MCNNFKNDNGKQIHNVRHSFVDSEVIIIKSIYLLLTFSFLILISGCGYHFSRGGNLPNNTKTVYIEIFKNKTTYACLNTILINNITNVLIRNGNVKITNMAQANAILSGIISSLTVDSLTQTEDNNTIDQRLTIKVDIKLKDSKGNIIRYIKNISSDEDYHTDLSDKEKSNANKYSAIEKLTSELAEIIYNYLTMDF